MRHRELLIDVVVTGVALAISVGVLAGSELEAGVRDADLAGYALLVLYTTAPIARRRAPVAAALVGLLSGVAYAAAGYTVALTPVVLLSIYTAGSELPTRRSRQVLAAGVVLGLLGATLSPGPTDVAVPSLIVAAWLLGRYVGSRRDYTAELEEQNRRLADARLELADRAVADERLRIARELHDVVAHRMSVVAVHAGTGRMVAAEDPEAAQEALATIETATRSALQEMRSLLSVLRSPTRFEGGDREPTPGLLDLDALVADIVTSGVTVEVRVTGPRPDVPAGVDLSAYRIVQEALTNVIRHAGRARARVGVEYGHDHLRVTVEDDGPPHPVDPPVPGGGHGLVGMRERVALYGGDFVAGPRPGAGFRVSARLPFGDGR